MRILLYTILTLAPVVMPAYAQPDAEAGRRSYEVCAGCHGFLGEGNALVGAPRLVGIERWYLEAQIESFRAGRRGYSDDDVSGKRMALMAQAVDGDRELGDLLTWIGTLPAPANGSDDSADPEELSRGQGLYALCAACHGPEAQGNEGLRAPALVTLDDWYLAEQLRLYAEGLRGAHPADTYGAQMRALSTNFDSDEERQALASYIATLRL
jgi:cytochrome c553